MSYFTFTALECPKDARILLELPGPWEVCPKQKDCFSNFFEENLRFTSKASLHEEPSRGQKTLSDLVTELEEIWDVDVASSLDRHDRKHDLSCESLVQNSLPVLPERLDVPSPARAVRPEDILKEPKRSQSLNCKVRVNHDFSCGDRPRCCYRVDGKLEAEIRELLLRSGMASLIPEDDIERWGDNRFLLCFVSSLHISLSSTG